MVNKVTLIGRTGQDVETKRLESGAVVSKVSIATSESFRDKSGEWQEATEWHDVVAWRNMAERLEGLPKGALLYIEGKLTHRSWQDKDGNNRKTTEVLVNYFRRLEKQSKETTVMGTTFNHPPATQPAETANLDSGGGADDDLPF